MSPTCGNTGRRKDGLQPCFLVWTMEWAIMPSFPHRNDCLVSCPAFLSKTAACLTSKGAQSWLGCSSNWGSPDAAAQMAAFCAHCGTTGCFVRDVDWMQHRALLVAKAEECCLSVSTDLVLVQKTTCSDTPGSTSLLLKQLIQQMMFHN